jgi:hypothetical protein
MKIVSTQNHQTQRMDKHAKLNAHSIYKNTFMTLNTIKFLVNLVDPSAHNDETILEK